jgi:hypothetical protein
MYGIGYTIIVAVDSAIHAHASLLPYPAQIK